MHHTTCLWYRGGASSRPHPGSMGCCWKRLHRILDAAWHPAGLAIFSCTIVPSAQPLAATEGGERVGSSWAAEGGERVGCWTGFVCDEWRVVCCSCLCQTDTLHGSSGAGS